MGIATALAIGSMAVGTVAGASPQNFIAGINDKD